MFEKLLTVEDLSVAYGGKRVVRGVMDYFVMPSSDVIDTPCKR